MLLLFCSIILVLASSFFIANILDSKNIIINIICFYLSAFANIVLTFELLSLFSGITVPNVLIVNFLFALISFLLWRYKKFPILKYDFKAFGKRFLNAIKLDKTIAVLSIGFIFACIISLFLIYIIPGIDVDSTTYRVIRSLFWVDHGNLNQFPAAEPRMLMFPINSEILYAWFILFLKNDIFLFVFNFCGVGLFLTVVYGILSEITASFRKKMWVIFIAASIPFVLLRFTGLETGVIVSALVLSSLYLYIVYLKNHKNSICFMSALALALGVGTKTTVILILPAAALWFLWYSVYCEKNNFYKPLVRFGLYFLAAFVLFASYNYISNFIYYGHFISSMNIAIGHANSDGFLSTFSNIYRYIFDFFAFPEFIWSSDLSTMILRLREGLLNFLNANNGFGRTFVVYSDVMHGFSSAGSSVGFFGPLLFIPVYIFAIYKSFCIKNRKTFLLVSLVYVFLITLFVMANRLAFMSYNIRFLSTFVLLTMPVISYFYNKKYGFYKILLTFIAACYLFTIPAKVSLYPVNGILNAFSQGASLEDIHRITECTFYTNDINIKDYKIRDVSCMVSDNIRKYNPQNKILFFASSDNSLMPIKRLMFDGYTIDIALATEIDKVNLNDYNIIITCNDMQTSRTIMSYDLVLDEYGYIRNKGVVCKYLGYDDDILKDLSADTVKESVCNLDKEFVSYNNLKLLHKTIYRVGYEADGSAIRLKYKFYENKNNPVIK